MTETVKKIGGQRSPEHIMSVTNPDNMWLPKPVTKDCAKTRNANQQDAIYKEDTVHLKGQ